MKTKQGFYWHVHHDKLVEYCYNYKERAEYIKKNKPKHEIKTRLRLFKPVKGKLPKEIIEAGRNYDGVCRKWVEAGRKYAGAWQKCDEVWQKCDEVEALRKYIEAWRKYIEAVRKLNEARRKCAEAGRKYIEVWRKCDEVLKKHKPFIEKLHKKECGCKEWNGERIVFGASNEDH